MKGALGLKKDSVPFKNDLETTLLYSIYWMYVRIFTWCFILDLCERLPVGSCGTSEFRSEFVTELRRVEISPCNLQ